MAQVTFVSGEAILRRDYTPTIDVVAGDVICFEDTVGIAHRDIAADELGSLALGHGTYDGPTAVAINDGEWVYWNDTSNGTGTITVNGGDFFLGLAVSSTDSGGGTVRFLHIPSSPEA